MATYKIKSGDTLSKIAKRLGTTVAALMAANKNSIKDKNKIRAGATLKLPSGMGMMEKDGGKARLKKSKEKSALSIIKKDTDIGTTKAVKKYNLKGGGKGTAAERLAEIDKEKSDAKKKAKGASFFSKLAAKLKGKTKANQGGAMMKKKTKYMAKGGYGTPTKKMKMKAGGATKKTKYMARGGAGMKKTKYMAKGGAAKRK